MNWSRVEDVAYFLVNLFVAGCLGFAINFYITMRRQGIPCNDWLVGALMGLIAGMMLASWLWHAWYKGIFEDMDAKIKQPRHNMEDEE